MSISELLAARGKKLSPAEKKALLSKLKGKTSTLSSAPSITRLGRSSAPLSAAQQRLWFEWLLQPENTAYHLGGGLVLKGHIDETALQQSLQHLLLRHQGLSSCFIEGDNGLPVQKVQADMVVPLEKLSRDELAQMPHLAGLDREAMQQALLADFAAKPFDLRSGPLLRVKWVQQEDQAHLLLVVMHHIVSDAWSKELIIQDFVGFYNQLLRGEIPEHDAERLQYTDFAQWQNDWLASKAPEVEQQWQFWQQEFAQSLPSVQLGRDNKAGTASGEILIDHLPFESAQQVLAFARSQGVSVFAVLFTAYQLLLQRWTGLEELLTAVPVANRNQYDIQKVVGFFVNMQLLRIPVSGADTLAGLLQRCFNKAQAVQGNQDIPVDALFKRFLPDLAGETGYQVMFNHLKDSSGQLQMFEGLELSEYLTLTQGAMCDLALDTTELSGGGIKLQWAYDETRLSQNQVASLNRHFQSVLQQLLNNADMPVRELALLSEHEQEQLAQWGQGADSGQTPLIHQAFRQQVEQTPNAEALVFVDTRLSYQQLNEQVNRLAHYLLERGIGAESKVGIALERSTDMVVAMLATLKAGAAYVPFDLDYPQQRLEYMCQHSGCDLLFSHQTLLARLPQVIQDRAVCLDTLELSALSSAEPEVEVNPQNLAYVIYTSGSTGQPKGVACNHLGVANRLAWMQSSYSLSAQDRVLQKTPFGFDVSVWEFFWPLMQGSTLVLAQPGQHKEPTQLQALIEQQQVTILHFVPSMLSAFLSSADASACTSLRQVFTSGEALSQEAANSLLAALPDVALHNLYGPTEAAIDATHWTCQADATGSVPIGAPIAGVRVYVLDNDLNRVPAGVPGELFLGGVCLARGYLNRADLSADRFVADPFSADGERLYRTGDLVCWNEAGQIEYLGRLDHQVKIRGFRIELGEIETQLTAQESVQEAVVLTHKNGTTDMLVAYVVGTGAEEAELKQALAKVLPDYMVPSVIMVLPVMPKTVNGKLDRKALPAPQWQQAVYVAPEGEIETSLADIWQSVLKLEQVGRSDNFFALGGHSLLAVEALTRLQQQWQVELTVRDLFENPVLQELAQLIEQQANPAKQDALSDLDAFMETL